MVSFAVALVISLVVSLGILRLAFLGKGLGQDKALGEPRRLHAYPVPRIGGMAVFVAALIGAALIRLKDEHTGSMILTLFACALPAFAGGFAEDLTSRVPPRVRLLMMLLSTLIGLIVLDLRVPRFDIQLLDGVLDYAWIAFPLTVLGMLTITNGMNLIDGLNGLAGMVGISMFGGLALVGYFALSQALAVLPYAIAVAAASLIYVAVADLIPGLHRRVDPQGSLMQVALIALGVVVIVACERLLG